MRKLQYLALTLAATVGLASCSDENPWVNQEGVGGIRLSLTADGNVADAVPQTRAAQTLTPPDASLFGIHLVKADNSVDKSWNNIEAFNAETTGFNTGAYTISASYGDIENEGFDAPAYYGEASVMVLEGETTETTITASLANTMVSIDFTDAFKTFFPDYAAQVHSEGHSYVDIAKSDEGRPAYLAPGNVSISLTLTQPNTGKTTTIQPAEFEARARHHYHVTLDYNNGNVGEGEIKIIFDDSVETEDVIIDLTDELFSAPVPTIAPAGFVSATPLELLEGSALAETPKMTVNAAGKIKDANLTISSEGKTFSGGKTEVNLTEASDADKALLEQWGIKCVGFFKNPDRFGTIDLAQFASNLPAGTHTVTLQVKDMVTHVSEPIQFSVVVEPIQFTLAPASAIFGADELDVTVNYNGQNLKDNLSFKVLNNSGNYVDAPIKSVVESTRSRAAEMKSYVVTLGIPSIERASSTLKLYYKGVEKMSASFGVVFPKYEVAIDAYSNYFDVKVTPEDPALTASITKALRLFITGENNTSVTYSSDLAKGIIRGRNVLPGKSYKVETTLDRSSSPAMTTSTTFTTENATPVPNGDFSDILENSLNISNLNVGGSYKVAFVSNQKKSDILHSEPASWANINAITAYPQSNDFNTWFVVPSTYINNGTVIIRSVGYSHNGTKPKESGSFTNTNYYCENTPAESEFTKVAGQLFLGSYSFDGTEHRTDGIAFASRPASLSFDYSYAPIASEQAEVYIKVYAADNSVIAQNTARLDAASSLTNTTLALPAYPFGKKAAKIELCFKSTSGSNVAINIPTGSALKESEGDISMKISANNYHALATGSVLTVDNVVLGYSDQTAAAALRAKKGAAKKSPKRAKR